MSREPYVGLREAAERLGVHYMTVYRYVRIGQLPAHRNGATWLVAVEDLDRLREPNPKPSRSRNSRQHRPTWLVDRLVAGDEPGAWLIVEDALASGTSVQEVYVDILVPALRAIGEQWEEGRLTIAAEHQASAVAGRLVGRLGPKFARRGLPRGTSSSGHPRATSTRSRAPSSLTYFEVEDSRFSTSARTRRSARSSSPRAARTDSSPCWSVLPRRTRSRNSHDSRSRCAPQR